MRDLTYQEFGRLVALKLHEVRKYKSAKNVQTKAYWLCVCHCGKEKVIRAEHLTSGRIVSCGCWAREKAADRLRTHGLTGTPEYGNWASMLGRIRSPVENHAFYKQVKVCERWLKFENFLADMGKKPTPKHSIDRIDPYGDYEPSNCRWATAEEQMQNQRRNYKLYAKFNELNPVVPWRTFSQRVRVLGWTPEKAATTSKMKNQFG